jgi:hypothetical protein
MQILQADRRNPLHVLLVHKRWAFQHLMKLQLHTGKQLAPDLAVQAIDLEY